MRTRLILLALGLCPAAGRPQSPYAYVPASPAARVMGTIEVPRAASEDDVVLVGVPVAGIALAAASRVVTSFGLPGPEVDARPASAPESAPQGTLVPDPAGRVWIPAPVPGAGDPSDCPNPFVARGRRREAPAEAAFACGGIILGGERGPVGLVNGHLVSPGDPLGAFRVRGIFREGLVVEASGSLVLLPVARTTRILVP